MSLSTILDSAIELAAPHIAERGQSFRVSKPEDEVWLDADAVRLSQVVGNLLNNASKFTPHAGVLALAVTRSADSLRIVVADNGKGISQEFLPTVFELFSQGETSLERASGGLGIGLSLVKGLVELHAGASRRIAGARGRHDVAVVNDGREAVEAARVFRPDTILLDLGLPGVDGFELAQRFRALPETSGAKVVAVTGYGQASDRARTKASGFDLHLVKPVDPDKLSRVLSETRA